MLGEVRGQETIDTVRLSNNALSVVPQYVLISGIRVDYERRLGKGDFWLVLAPQFYNDNSNANDYYYWYYRSSNP